jgi:hypothetical protein
MTQYVNLSKDMMARVSGIDYALLQKHKWCVSNGYAASRIDGHLVYMHRLILNAPAGVGIDHIDGDKLNNERGNLRLATQRQNMRNQPRHRQGTSGYKGVSLRNDTGKYAAHITVDYKKLSLGCYADPVVAARAYDEAARLHFGEFARLNFPEGY